MSSSIIYDSLKQQRPNLKDKSLNAYTSTLKSLYRKVYPDDLKIDVNKFVNNQNDFLQYLQNVEYNKRKSILSALVVLCGDDDCEQYRELMKKDIETYEANELNQEKTLTQKENWITQDEIKNVFEFHKKEANKLFKLDKFTSAQFQTLQNYIILCLLTGQDGFPPRRALDYTEMLIRDYDKNKDNVFDGKDFIFNVYKTVKTYNRQEFTAPKQLSTVLKKWVKINTSNYLLVDRNGEKLTPVKLNQRLNKIFGKKVGVNILRHSFLTENTKSVKDLKTINQRAQEMGHSVGQALLYIKK